MQDGLCEDLIMYPLHDDWTEGVQASWMTMAHNSLVMCMQQPSNK